LLLRKTIDFFCSELADRSSLRTHLARHGAEEGGAISSDKIDVSRKPAGATPGTSGSKKSKKKKKNNNNEIPPPQILNPMVAMTSGISPRTLDAYSMHPSMINPHMSLPIIKSEPNEGDPKRKRGRPPKMKSADGTTPTANYNKHSHVVTTSTLPAVAAAINPAMNNAIVMNDQHGKNDPHKAAMRSPRGIDISSELAELARSRMREVNFNDDDIFHLS
jgi:hypothetical protein